MVRIEICNKCTWKEWLPEPLRKNGNSWEKESDEAAVIDWWWWWWWEFSPSTGSYHPSYTSSSNVPSWYLFPTFAQNQSIASFESLLVILAIYMKSNISKRPKNMRRLHNTRMRLTLGSRTCDPKTSVPTAPPKPQKLVRMLIFPILLSDNSSSSLEWWEMFLSFRSGLLSCLMLDEGMRRHNSSLTNLYRSPHQMHGHLSLDVRACFLR